MASKQHNPSENSTRVQPSLMCSEGIIRYICNKKRYRSICIYIYVYVWNMNAFDALGYLQLRRVDATTMTSVAIVAILRQVAVVALTSCSATRSVACARLAWYVRGCLIQWGKQMHYRPAKVWLIEAKRSWTVKFEKWITYCNYRTD